MQWRILASFGHSPQQFQPFQVHAIPVK
jgi:hypothetical protein